MNFDALRSSPFALMIAPEEVFRALAQSEALNRLQARVCRPLDKMTPTLAAATLASDAEIDAAPEETDGVADSSLGSFGPSSRFDGSEGSGGASARL